MPTTPEEAAKIAKICVEEGISLLQLVKLMDRLQNEVGEHSDNDSVKQTMRMLYKTAIYLVPGVKPPAYNLEEEAEIGRCDQPEAPIYDEYKPVEKPKFELVLWFILSFVVSFHTLIWICLTLSSVALAFWTPIYVSFPLIVFMVTQATTEEQCPITKIENCLRNKLGLRSIDHFGSHYTYKASKFLSKNLLGKR